MANEFQDATVIVGVPGINGGGISSGDLASAIAGVAPGDAKYIVQTASSDLSAEQALGSLATGILKNTATTGVLTIATGSDLPSHNHSGVVFSLTFPFDGDGSAIATGVWYDRGIIVPVASTVTGWIIDGDDDAVVTIQRAPNSAPGTFSAISGSEKPTLSGVNTNSDTNLTTWTGDGAIAALDRLRPSVDSADATALSVTLLFTRSI